MSDTWGLVLDACTQANGLMAVGRHDEAAQVLRTALASAPDSPDLLGDLARAELGRKRPEVAERMARSALAKSPDDPWLHLILSSVMGAQERIDESITWAERAVALAPNDPNAHGQLAFALVRRLPASQRTLDECHAAIALAPAWARPHVVAGLHHEVIRDLGTATRAYEQALALDPENADALMGLARIGASTAATVEMSRRAGRAQLGDARPMRLLRSRARLRILVVVLGCSAPLPWLLAALLGPTMEPASASFVALASWAGGAFLVARLLAPRVSLRWAEGRSTRWLFDGAIAAGRVPERPEMRAGITAIAAMLVFLAIGGLTVAIAQVRADDHPVPVVVTPDTAPPMSFELPNGSVWTAPDLSPDDTVDSEEQSDGFGSYVIVGPIIAALTVLSSRWAADRRRRKSL